MKQANATTTINQICKQIVTDSIDHDYLLECEASLKEIYDAECGYGRKAASPKACCDYLQGLPSVCTVPFENYEILSIIGDTVGVDFNDDDKCSEAIDQYWQECGKAFYDMVK